MRAIYLFIILFNYTEEIKETSKSVVLKRTICLKQKINVNDLQGCIEINQTTTTKIIIIIILLL